MVLEAIGEPLKLSDWPQPQPNPGQVLVQIEACGVCRTDLHIVEGDLPQPTLPLIPGHQIVGKVVALGEGVRGFTLGDRVGIPWLGHTCCECRFCLSERENLCDRALFTGYTLNGGYAEYTVADERFCLPLPAAYDALQVAPLLCAGLIGYRAYRLAGPGQRLGFYGFGAAAHILIQVARYHHRQVYAFTRPGDEAGQTFARQLGAVWAGGSDQVPPERLDAAIIFAPVGALVPAALEAVDKGGRVVCAGIHMSEIPAFPYRLLWEERSLCSVANLTRKDGLEFLALAPQIPVHTAVQTFPLAQANEALTALRSGAINGAAVLQISSE